jgi:hypothetical protein
MDTNITEENRGMGLFSKSAVTIKRDTKTAAHAARHKASLLSGRRHELLDKSLGLLGAAEKIVADAYAAPSDEATGDFPDLTAERAEVARLQDVVTRRRREAEAADADLAVKKAASTRPASRC